MLIKTEKVESTIVFLLREVAFEVESRLDFIVDFVLDFGVKPYRANRLEARFLASFFCADLESKFGCLLFCCFLVFDIWF